MGILEYLPQVLEAGRRDSEETIAGRYGTVLRSPALPRDVAPARPMERTDGTDEAPAAHEGEDQLVQGENAAYMRYLLCEAGMAGKVQLVYIDPPFFTKSSYDATVRLPDATRVRHHAYTDIWEKGLAQYLQMLACRLFLVRDLLSDTGTVWVHVDWHAAHYVRLLLDEIFGARNFINEIVWTYKSGGAGKRHFARKHDTILLYGKTSRYYLKPPKEKSYNRGLKPYRFKGVREYEDETGWYTLVTMKDVWPIDMVGRTAAERTGYATQKPLALLSRIVEAGSREGDICADFFCGSGTLAVAARRAGRHFICCDQEKLAVSVTAQRLAEAGIAAPTRWLRALRAADGFEDGIGPHREDADGESGEPGAAAAGCAADAEAGDGRTAQVGGGDVDGTEAGVPSYEGEIRAVRRDMRIDAKYIRTSVQLGGLLLRSASGLDGLADAEREPVAEALCGQSVSMIAAWSVDPAYDGRAHRVKAVMLAPKKGTVPTTWEVVRTAAEARGTVHLLAADVLGNLYTCLLPPTPSVR